MNINLNKIRIADLVDGYCNDEEEGVVGYHGKLDIRPKYQREFVYKAEQQKAVIDTIIKGYPPNVMYWVKRHDSTFEVLDGQQRTLSICAFYAGNFSIEIDGHPKYFSNLTPDKQGLFMNYELTVYICSDGIDSERIAWFKTINIAGEKLTNQEILNSEYSGSWLTEAKRKFSKTNCVASMLGKDYISCSPIRQELLEKVLKWISNNDIEQYMSVHQHDTNADAEWQYFQNVINWIRVIFPVCRKEMKKVDWGTLYNKYKDNLFSATELEKRVKELMLDDDVTNKAGIYPYLITGEERNLNLRTFSEKIRREAYEAQNGICPQCGKTFDIGEMEADHITPWSRGGTTTADNCQMLRCQCNRIKSNK